MEETPRAERFPQLSKRWTVSEEIFLPGNVFPEFIGQATRERAALCRPLGFVIFVVTTHREKKHQIPVIALTVAHPQRSFVDILQRRRTLFVEVDQLQQFPRRSLYQGHFVEVGIVGGRGGNCARGSKQKQRNELCPHSDRTPYAESKSAIAVWGRMASGIGLFI